MSTEDQKAIVRRTIEEGWNQGNTALIDELFAPSYIHHDSANPNVGSLEDYKQWVTRSHNAFPDLHITIEDMLAEGDKVVTRWTFRGTHTGDIVTLMPLPATGKQVTQLGINIDRLADGKIVEAWHQGDAFSLLQQLGVIPVPRQAK